METVTHLQLRRVALLKLCTALVGDAALIAALGGHHFARTRRLEREDCRLGRRRLEAPLHVTELLARRLERRLGPGVQLGRLCLAGL